MIVGVKMSTDMAKYVNREKMGKINYFTFGTGIMYNQHFDYTYQRCLNESYNTIQSSKFLNSNRAYNKLIKRINTSIKLIKYKNE